MQHGADRVDVPYIWPTRLRQPERPPQLVYLDLNHWITLARALAGKKAHAASPEVIQSLLEAKDSGAAVFPLTETTFIEVSKIQSHRQRRDLRRVIERLSSFQVVSSRLVIAELEIEAMLDEKIGPGSSPVVSVPYLDWGVERAFGKVGGIRVRSIDGGDVTEEVRASWPEGKTGFDMLVAGLETELVRGVLEGPAPDEEPEFRNLGWEPSSTKVIAERRAGQEEDQSNRFDADLRWRRGRIRDALAAREVAVEFKDVLGRGLDERGATLEELWPTPQHARESLDAMPSFDVALTMKVEYHRNSTHRWSANDIHDIDALGSVLPYCDVVVTDKAAMALVQRTGLADRLDTIILSDLESLTPTISCQN